MPERVVAGFSLLPVPFLPGLGSEGDHWAIAEHPVRDGLGMRQPPDGVVAGFSLRPIALLSEARHQRVAIGRRALPAPPVLGHRTFTGYVIASHPEPFGLAHTVPVSCREGEGGRGNRLDGEIAKAPRRGMWK